MSTVQAPLSELTEVDVIISRSIAAGDPMIAAEYGNRIHRAALLRGIGLAKLLSGLRENWKLFQVSGIGESFEDFVQAHFVNLDSSTATRYADMYEAVFVTSGIPFDLKIQLSQKPIRQLLLLTAAVREGSIGSDELEEAVLKNEAGIREMVREARGAQTKSKKATYAKIVGRDNSSWGPRGALIVFQDGDHEHLGFLNPVPEKSFTRQYLDRIKNALGIGEL